MSGKKSNVIEHKVVISGSGIPKDRFAAERVSRENRAEWIKWSANSHGYQLLCKFPIHVAPESNVRNANRYFFPASSVGVPSSHVMPENHVTV